MNQVKDLLEARKSYLLQLKSEKENALRAAPEGALRISNHNGKKRYYRKTDPKDPNGVYIKTKDYPVVLALAQKDYDKKVLRTIEKELTAIGKFDTSCPDINVEQIYKELNKERQELIIPVMQTDEKYISEWESIKYNGKSFSEDTPEFYTAKGERVRSKSEVIIADTLNREGIPYRYEYPLILNGRKRIYPDFTVLNIRLRKEMYWEHLGMMDDAGYMESALKKITYYQENGIFPGEKLILTYETRQNPMNQKLIQLMISHYLR